MRAVLDTTTVVSAVRSARGASAMVVGMALTRQFTLLMDYKIACEYRDVALRSEHLDRSHLAPWQIEVLIAALETAAEPVEVAWKHRPLSIDANDDLVLDVAINGCANVIVTNNVRHFSDAAAPFGIQVVQPKQFLITMKAGGIYGSPK